MIRNEHNNRCAHLGTRKRLHRRAYYVLPDGREYVLERVSLTRKRSRSPLVRAHTSSSPLADQLLRMRKAPLSQEDMDAVEKWFRVPSSLDVITEVFDIPIRVTSMQRLMPGKWLDDEIINAYMMMLNDRDQRLCRQIPSRRCTRFFNTFFYSKLMEGGVYDYTRVRRWTKRVDVFACEKLVIPINLSNTHWILVVIYVQAKEMHLMDSMGPQNRSSYLDNVGRWLGDEYRVRKKNGKELDVGGWKKVFREDVPLQRNGFDCGMFVITAADYLADNLPLEYTQEDMPLNRLKVGSALLKGRLPY